MATRKKGTASKGKAPAKRSAPPRPSSPVVSSSSDEDLPDYAAIWDKLSRLEQERARMQGLVATGPGGRPARDTKARKRAELHRMGELMMSRIAFLEGELAEAARARSSVSTQLQTLPATPGLAPSAHPRSQERQLPPQEPRDEGPDLQLALDLSASRSGEVPSRCLPLGPPVRGESITHYTSGSQPVVWPWGPSQRPLPVHSPSLAPASGWAANPELPVNLSSSGATEYARVEAASQTEALPCPQDASVQADPVKPDLPAVSPVELPEGDESLPLGDHLSQAMVDKILSGRFVDIFELLNREIEEEAFKRLDDKEKEKIRRKKPERSWTNWLSAYLIYAGIIVKAHPERAWGLFQYLDTIHRAHLDFAGSAWLQYDEGFRMRAARRPSLRWDEPYGPLWMRVMAPARPLSAERFDSGHLAHRSGQPAFARPSAGQTVQPRAACWEFNSKGSCNRRQCKFKHICSGCGGAHAATVCSKGKAGGFPNRDNGGKKTPPGASSVPKGT